jgi:uncharacterized membrane protein YsdA (DUF1294 family)/cold shock CspA family protein
VRGRIIDWKDNRGFGFIEPESGGERLFFHISGTYGTGRPAIGTEVCYELSRSSDGRLRASSVAPIGVGLVQKRSIPSKAVRKETLRQPKWLWIPAMLVFPLLWWLEKLGKTPSALFWLFSGASFLTFLLYGLDKLAAKRDAQRTPEQTLQLCALLCGWPGALLAQQIFRHKSSKASFQTVYWLMVVLNIGAVVLLILSPNSPFRGW